MKAINEKVGKNYHIYNADCIDIAQQLPDNSIDFSIYSPPFASLFTFSNSDRDMSNVKSVDEFMEQYRFLVKEMFRTAKPGRLSAIHCCELPTTLNTHGYIGLIDFPALIRQVHQEEGFIYHSRITIWKDPVIARARTNALGLLHKTVRENRAMVRQGIPDEIIVMRKPGEQEKKIKGFLNYYVGEMSLNEYAEKKYHNVAGKFIEFERQDGSTVQKTDDSAEMSIDIWQHYASPVWFDIRQSNTLEFRSGRDPDDEKHISPLQLDVIERCTQLWSAKDEVVFSPFLGIGSEGYVALQMGRKFIGTELKESYFNLAAKNLDEVENQPTQLELF